MSLYNISVSAFVGILTLPALSADAGVLDLFGVTEDIEKIVDQTLPDIEGLANRITSRGENSGDVLLVQAGNEAAMAISYARQVFGDTLDDLDATSRRMLLDVDRSLRTVDRSTARLVQLSDMAAIDISIALDSVPLTSEAPFAIRRLEGAIIPPIVSAAGHTIRILGPNFSRTSELTVSLRIDDQVVPVEVLSGDNQHTMDLVLSQSLIDQFKLERQVSITRAQIEISKEADGLFPRWRDPVTAMLDIRLTFLPDIAGTIQPVYLTRTTDWLPNAEPKTEPFRVLPGESATISDRPAATSSGPAIGDKRVIPTSITASCETDIRPAYRFPKKVIPADSEIFVSGWTGVGSICATGWTGGVVGANPGWQSSVFSANRFRDEFGVRQRRTIGLLNRYDHGGDNSCTLLPDELRSLGESIDYDFSPCRTVHVSPPLVNAENNIVTWEFFGSGTAKATYTLSATFETFAFTEPRELVETTGETQEIEYGINEVVLFVDDNSQAFVEFSPVWSPAAHRFSLNDVSVLEDEPQITQVGIDPIGDVELLRFTYSP